MKAEIDNVLRQAELLIRNGQTEAAKQALDDLYRRIPEEDLDEALPRILFDMGNAAIIEGDHAEALEMYDGSILAGSEDVRVLFNLAGVLEEMGEFSLEQDVLEEAAGRELDEVSAQFIFQALHRFYLRRELYQKARRTAERYIRDRGETYFGYHLLVEGMFRSGEYAEAEEELDRLEEKFREDPGYLRDRLDLLDRQKLYDQELQLTEQDPNYRKLLPELTLQRRLRIFLDRRQDADVRETARELFVGWGDEMGALTQMVLFICDGNDHAAARVADYILKQNAAAPNMLFYLTLYIDLFVVERIAGGELSEEQRATLTRAAKLCVGWFRQNGLYDRRMEEQLTAIGLRLDA